MSRALDGIRVVDLGQVYNGPYCTHLLGELGADVLKVEPLTGDAVRRETAAGQQTAAFPLLNGGKRSLRLNLKHPDGIAVLRRLAERSDVLVENFAPGTMTRLGLSYPELSRLNPRLVYASGRGYGPDSPFANHRAMDLTVQAMTAVIATTGDPGKPPVKAGPALADFFGGVHLAAAILAALVQRGVTGRGQQVQVAMEEAVVPSLTSSIAGFLDTGGRVPERTGNRHGGLAISPYNVYPAADGWVAVLCLTDRHWEALCTLMERPELAADPRLASPSGRVAEMDEVDEIVSAWSRTLSRDPLFERLHAAGIPAAPVRTIRDLMETNLVGPEGMLRPVSAPGADEPAYTLGSPLRLSCSPARPPLPSPGLGEHTDEILTDVLHLEPDEIRRLREQHVIEK